MVVQRARAGAWPRLVVPGGGEFTGRGVEFVDVNFVRAEVVDGDDAIVGRDAGEVGVGGFLAIFDRARAGVVLAPDGFAEFAIGGEEACGAAAGIVGADDDVAGVIGGQMAGAFSLRCDVRYGCKLPAGFGVGQAEAGH